MTHAKIKTVTRCSIEGYKPTPRKGGGTPAPPSNGISFSTLRLRPFYCHCTVGLAKKRGNQLRPRYGHSGTPEEEPPWRARSATPRSRRGCLAGCLRRSERETLVLGRRVGAQTRRATRQFTPTHSRPRTLLSTCLEDTRSAVAKLEGLPLTCIVPPRGGAPRRAPGRKATRPGGRGN